MPNELPTWREVIAQFGLTLRRAGRSLRGPCPLHHGSNPTAFVITEGAGFFCHACGAGGGVREFLHHMGDHTFDGDALGGREPTWSARRPSGWLASSAASQEPIVSIGPLDPDHPALRARGVDRPLAEIFECGYYQGGGLLHHRIVFPVHDAQGTLVGHIGRAVGNSEPRYLMSRGFRKSEILYNAHRARCAKTSSIIVVEGVFDAIAVHAAGFPNVVALLGCTASKAQVRLLREPQVLVLFDRDRAGWDAARVLAARLGERARIVTLPPTDPAMVRSSILANVLAQHSNA